MMDGWMEGWTDDSLKPGDNYVDRQAYHCRLVVRLLVAFASVSPQNSQRLTENHKNIREMSATLQKYHLGVKMEENLITFVIDFPTSHFDEL